MSTELVRQIGKQLIVSFLSADMIDERLSEALDTQYMYYLFAERLHTTGHRWRFTQNYPDMPQEVRTE